MHSALYTGWVRHRRFAPRHHAFRYRVFMVYADTAEIDRLCATSRWWSRSRWAPARFRREDFFGDPALELGEAVRRKVAAETGRRPQGPIRFLANWRYFGYNMNPITVYYCFDAAGDNVEHLLVEVNNTPWNERHAYVLPCDPSKNRQRAAFGKAMHVSPFMPMDIQYRWHGTTPGEHLVVQLDNLRGGERVFDATLRLERREATARALVGILVQFPLMTVKVVVAIYWQALKLWLKRVPLFGHPRSKREGESTARKREKNTHEVY